MFLALATMRTWLAQLQGAKHLIFLRTVKNRGAFHDFYARFFINAHFILWSACVSSYSRPCHLNWVLSLVNFWIPGAWLSKNILIEYMACLILSSPPYYLLLFIMINLLSGDAAEPHFRHSNLWLRRTNDTNGTCVAELSWKIFVPWIYCITRLIFMDR